MLWALMCAAISVSSCMGFLQSSMTSFTSSHNAAIPETNGAVSLVHGSSPFSEFCGVPLAPPSEEDPIEAASDQNVELILQHLKRKKDAKKFALIIDGWSIASVDLYRVIADVRRRFGEPVVKRLHRDFSLLDTDSYLIPVYLLGLSCINHYLSGNATTRVDVENIPSSAIRNLTKEVFDYQLHQEEISRVISRDIQEINRTYPHLDGIVLCSVGAEVSPLAAQLREPGKLMVRYGSTLSPQQISEGLARRRSSAGHLKIEYSGGEPRFSLGSDGRSALTAARPLCREGGKGGGTSQVPPVPPEIWEAPWDFFFFLDCVKDSKRTVRGLLGVPPGHTDSNDIRLKGRYQHLLLLDVEPSKARQNSQRRLQTRLGTSSFSAPSAAYPSSSAPRGVPWSRPFSTRPIMAADGFRSRKGLFSASPSSSREIKAPRVDSIASVRRGLEPLGSRVPPSGTPSLGDASIRASPARRKPLEPTSTRLRASSRASRQQASSLKRMRLEKTLKPRKPGDPDLSVSDEEDSLPEDEVEDL